MNSSRFQPFEFFTGDRSEQYRLLPFRFIQLDEDFVVVNEVGQSHFLDEQTLHMLVGKQLTPKSIHYEDLKAKHFLTDSDFDLPITLLATKYRTKKSFLSGFTALHIFVVSLRCDHTCHYCQVSRVSADKTKYDMDETTALAALELVFRSPADALKIEFQGGEPLLNFDLIRKIVLEAELRNQTAGRDLQFVITSNLAFLNDAILDFCNEHNVLISTSLDGPEFLHNKNRPRPGQNSYEVTVKNMNRVKETLGAEKLSALMTTTSLSLDYPELIVDEYIKQGFDHIVLRPISPYGFALKTAKKTGYVTERFLAFYKKALEYILQLNREGTFFVECYSQMLLRKILTPFATGYVDLQSPAGAGIGVAVYNYDGDVYPTDEARMLVEMGDDTFKLGNVHKNSYEEIFGGEFLRGLVASTCVESLPGCSDCAFQMYCGCDPVENFATQGSIFGHRPTSAFCRRNMEMIKHLLRLIRDDEAAEGIFWSWIQNVPESVLVPKLPAGSLP